MKTNTTATEHATAEKNISEILAEQNAIIAKAKATAKEIKAQMKLKKYSAYFVNEDNSEKLSRNMSETIRFLEQNNKGFLSACVKANNDKKLKVSEFHALLNVALNKK
jgi:hypothetical protein